MMRAVLALAAASLLPDVQAVKMTTASKTGKHLNRKTQLLL